MAYFEDIMYVVESLESELLNLVEHKIIIIEIKFVTKRFELIKQSIGRSYFTLIMQDIVSFFDSNKGDEKHVSSFGVHRTWFEGFALFIQDTKETKAPSLDHLTCTLALWLGSMEFDLYAYSMHEHQNDMYAKIFLTHRELHSEALYIITMIARGEYTIAVSHLNKMFSASLTLEQYISTLQINYTKNKSANFFNYIEYKSKYEDELYYFTSIVFSDTTIKVVKEFLYKNGYEIEGTLKNIIIKTNFDGIVFVNEHTVSLLLKEKKNNDGMEVMEFINNHIYKKMAAMAAKYDIKVKILGVKIDDIYRISKSVVPILHLLKVHKQEESVGLLNSSDINTIYGKVVENDKIKAEINRAFKENLFEIFFQPIVKSAAKSKNLFVEALIRLPYNGEFLEGENFIKLIEEQNRMNELDVYVLKNLHKHIAKLSEVAKTVAVNIYPTSFEYQEVMDEIVKVSKALKKAGIEFIVEITEQMLLLSKTNILMLAKEHGINFAIDDFGSGYSSFTQLIELAEMGVIKIIKIDGTIVKGSEENPTKYNILKTLADMTISLNIKPLIFEFVENEKLYNKLKNLKGDILYQGYYFDKALPIDELVTKYKI
ncbi:EAL domain-containing protein [bacterium]|nr:EAL domain-containing protein [bacterium]MBU1993512.1 EAL domain-containing protein [bacterium]